MMDTYNPLESTAGEAEDLITSTFAAARRLENAIQMERIAKARAQDAKDALASAEAETVHEYTLLGKAGEGPLANIAVTSKAFTYAVDVLIAEAHQNGLSAMYRDANRLTIEADNAAIELQQAQVAYSACKAVCELKAAILAAKLGRY